MSTYSQINELKKNQIRCYYIDSDGDEVIVSDDEDFEVALEYVKAKGEGKVKFFPTVRQDDSSDDERFDPKLKSENSLKLVADTVSIDGDDDHSSEDEEEKEIRVVDSQIDLQKETEENNDFNKKLNANVQDTVSRDSSIYCPDEERMVSEQSERLIKECAASIFNDMEIVERDFLDQAISEPSNSRKTSEAPSSNGVHDYQLSDKDEDKHENFIIKKECDQPEPTEKVAKTTKSDEKVEEEKKSDAVEIHDGKKDIIEDPEEASLMEMNSSVAVSDKSAPKDSALKEFAQNELQLPVEDSKVADEPEEENKEEFMDEPRLSVAMSVAKALVIKPENEHRINYLHRAIDNIKFIFNDPAKKQQIAQIDECDEEHSQDYVVTCKPGKFTKKRWRVVNNSTIPWPRNTIIKCQSKEVEAEIPKIEKPLMPGEKLDVSINIKVSEKETENSIKMYVFRFFNKHYGHFGSPLIATVEVVPDILRNPIEDLSQEERLKEILEGDEINPILYGIANDFVEEGLGTFDQCLEALLHCKGNFEEAKKALNHE